MLGASVPEAAVKENSHLGLGEDQVGTSSDAGQWTRGYAVTEAEPMDGAAERELWLGVETSVGSHARADARRGRPRII
jgi:hypothetical protein